ncbi:hypothetical protein [Niallia endozanthoxylica]|uniref:Uncharacterized protein n=1 Tax=Niallia endozanthoxylica TaxID=2036016 RepID=A0A5J5HQD2_9BACI|nr:hypothetical protein [Niallia endozanthoxylica]KAA9023899.1 hypothetical protein F4V44_12235 [Niallia endozanthoxylica]
MHAESMMEFDKRSGLPCWWKKGKEKFEEKFLDYYEEFDIFHTKDELVENYKMFPDSSLGHAFLTLSTLYFNNF